jgi:hypothetical protein
VSSCHSYRPDGLNYSVGRDIVVFGFDYSFGFDDAVTGLPTFATLSKPIFVITMIQVGKNKAIFAKSDLI